MEEIKEGHHARFLNGTYYVAVVVDTGLLHAVGAFRIDARPGNGEAECLEPQFLHACNILAVFMVKISRLIRIGAEIFFGVDRIKMLAYVLALAALMTAGLNLARGARRAEQEIFRKRKIHRVLLASGENDH